MKLYYFKFRDETKNFGDDLNPWLWNNLLPGFFENPEGIVFLGIGTILNEYVPKSRKTIVFGSGYGYAKAPPKIDDSWKIYCVRGPLTAAALNIDDKLAITDSALLIRKVYKKVEKKTTNFAFIPHVSSAILGDENWHIICRKANIKYIDPRWQVDEVLTAISQTEILLTEAMHGAILADAMRVPWIAISSNTQISSFKWKDWCKSVDLNYSPYYLMPSDELLYPCGAGIRSSLMHWFRYVKQDPRQIAKRIMQKDLDFVANQLSNITKFQKPLITKDSVIEKLTDQLEEKLFEFKEDYTKGKFA